jgi:hypothetical protein
MDFALQKGGDYSGLAEARKLKLMLVFKNLVKLVLKWLLKNSWTE